MRRLLFLPLGFSLLLSGFLNAKSIKYDYTEQNGARALGMGRAYTGVAEGLLSLMWNPSGLASIQKTSVYFSRYNGFTYEVGDTQDQISFNLFNVGMPIRDFGVVAFSMNLWDLGSSEVVDQPGNPVRLDHQSTLMIYGSYATRVSKKLDVGVSMKYIREKLSSEAGGVGTSVALDLGALYRPIEGVPLQVGLALFDVGASMQFHNEYQADRLPRRFRIGAGYNILKHLLDQDRFNLLLSADYERLLVGSPAHAGYFVGTEFSVEAYSDVNLSLRGGYLSEEGDLNGALFGFGISWKGFAFDLARELGVNDVNDRTYFSLGAAF